MQPDIEATTFKSRFTKCGMTKTHITGGNLSIELMKHM